jgi:hypothetical protein
MKLLFVSALLILSTICASDSIDVQEVRLNEKFNLPFGHKAVVRSKELEFVFSSVVEDSRCPQGDQCITAGNGEIELSVSESGKSAVLIRLNTDEEPQEESVGNSNIKLLDLNPYPGKGKSNSPQDYVATLLVTSKEN